MVRTKLKMTADLKEAFAMLKPLCDVLMVYPTVECLTAFSATVAKLKKEVVQELQQYMLYPIISRVNCSEIRKNVELHRKVLEAVKMVLDNLITVNSFEMYMKLETGLLCVIFDSSKQGMISDASEETKLCTVQCLTVLMLNIPHEFRVKLLKTQVPMLAQAVFVSVHIAKLERLRSLRLSAIQCVMAHTMTHPQITVDYRMTDPELEVMAVDNMLSSILPGVLAALQDVCACPDNPTHTVVVAAIEAIHRIICIPMHNKYLAQKPIVMADFITMLKEKKDKGDSEVSNKVQKSPKDMVKRSEEWYLMAGEKLTLITKSLVSLRVHDHFKVRKELAIFCYRILTECSNTMAPSVSPCLDVLISLCWDEYPTVSNYCASVVRSYFQEAPEHVRGVSMDSLCDNFISLLTSLPRLLNNFDESRKLSLMNLLHGYISILSMGAEQRLTGALSLCSHMQKLCTALTIAAQHNCRVINYTRTHTDISFPPPINSPWSHLQNLSSGACIVRLQSICQMLGDAQCAELVLDVLLERFQRDRQPEPLYILNWMITSPESTVSMARRMVYAYADQDVWYLPLEVGSGEPPVSAEETLDVSVYNPRAWDKDTVPGLYEGTVETRYTDITYSAPRVCPPRDPRYCKNLAEAQINLVLSCLLTEGVGLVATKLKEGFSTYLIKTLCPILERVGSEYELLHVAGIKALYAVAAACGHQCPGHLISYNADYFTNQVSVRLKKSWSCQSALKILSVVMEYSNSSIATSLYGITENVLLEGCATSYGSELQAYLQVFLTFVQCIRKWFPDKQQAVADTTPPHFDLMADVRDYVKNTQEAERLLSDSDFEKYIGQSVEEMYFEDLKLSEQDLLDCDEAIAKDNLPPPQHVLVSLTILERSLHFVTFPRRDISILALQILNQGLPILASHTDLLLPLVHKLWSPLVQSFHCQEPAVLRRAFDLLVTMAELAKDFIQCRTVKQVLPEIYKFLSNSSKDSYLKDKGSAYRNSQAYRLQETALEALPRLAVHLALTDERLSDAMKCVDVYLSNKQPKPLQASGVNFFKRMLDYDYPAAWYHLRKICDNNIVLEPPKLKYMTLEPVVGTASLHKDKDYNTNIQLIFDYMVS